MFENPLDLVWLIAAALAAVFGLASLVLAVDAVRRQYPGIVDVFGVLVLVLGVLVVAAGLGLRQDGGGQARRKDGPVALRRRLEAPDKFRARSPAR
jgi:hypothetical protein